jgi:hypothetical protein
MERAARERVLTQSKPAPAEVKIRVERGNRSLGGLLEDIYVKYLG